jgi:hypothetical protein
MSAPTSDVYWAVMQSVKTSSINYYTANGSLNVLRLCVGLRASHVVLG